MNNFNFGEILTKAWQIVWKNKVLWIFGILASCSAGRGNFNNPGNTSSYQEDAGTLSPDVQRMLQPVVEFFEGPNVMIFVGAIFALICIVMLLSIFLGTIGRIGLIKGAAQAEAGRESLVLSELWSESLPYFWRVFWLNFLAGLPFLLLILALLVGGALAFMAMAGTVEAIGEEALLGLIPLLGGGVFLFCCVGLASIVIQFIVNQAYNAIILEERGLVEGFTRGWEIITKNIGPMLVMAVILYIIQMVIGFVIALPILIIVVPMIIVTAASAMVGALIVPILFGVLCICLYAPIAWVVAGVLEAYTQSAWTLTFLKLTVQPQAPAAPPMELAQPQ